MWAVILKFSINTLKGFIGTIIQIRKQNAQQFYFKPQLYSNSHIKLLIFFKFEELYWKKYMGSNPKILHEYLEKLPV